MRRRSRTAMRIAGVAACVAAALVGAVASGFAFPHHGGGDPGARHHAASHPAVAGRPADPHAPGRRAAAGAPATPRIRHVFLIVLENQGYETTFGANTPATYLADTLAKQGALLTQYHGIGHFSLDNYIAMISGQAPDSATQADCAIFSDFVHRGIAAYGQAQGTGCVYPRAVRTIANQLAARHFTWRGYMEDMGNDPGREPATCGHVPIGTRDVTNRPSPKDQYAARHDPFVYFHSIIDDSASCHANVVPLTRLEHDLAAASRTPNYAFITPNVCHDGHDAPCVNGEPGGLVSASRFLQTWVPRILASPAFKRDGLLIITFDEAMLADPSACCNEQPGPNAAKPGLRGPGGGRIGAVLLSPFIAAGTVSTVPYNHYSMLRSVEDLFGLAHLGFAAQEGLAPFGADVYGASR